MGWQNVLYQITVSNLRIQSDLGCLVKLMETCHRLYVQADYENQYLMMNFCLWSCIASQFTSGFPVRETLVTAKVKQDFNINRHPEFTSIHLDHQICVHGWTPTSSGPIVVTSNNILYLYLSSFEMLHFMTSE